MYRYYMRLFNASLATCVCLLFVVAALNMILEDNLDCPIVLIAHVFKDKKRVKLPYSIPVVRGLPYLGPNCVIRHI